MVDIQSANAEKRRWKQGEERNCTAKYNALPYWATIII